MRILPRSLFGRLTLVLLTGLVAAQLLSASIMLRDRGQTLYQTIRSDLIDRTAGIIRLLEALPAAERRRLLPLLSTTETLIRIAREPAEAPAQDNVQRLTAGLIERGLKDRLPPGTEVRVTLEDGLREDVAPVGMPAMHRRHMLGRQGMGGPWAYLHGVQALARGFFIQARISDGSWIQFERRIPESREPSGKLDIMALLETIREDVRDAGWEVALNGQVTLPFQARPTALKRCISNLVENAARYGGGAEVLATDDGRTLRIAVRDRGPGVPPDLLEKVFDPFFRIESSRARHTGGTGLGLGIARNIARAHGGDLVLRNRAEGGLSAELTLPR